MPIELNDATAIVLIEGLSITKFNETRKRSETTFLHEARHKFNMKILEPINGESDLFYKFNHKPVGYEEIDISKRFRIPSIKETPVSVEIMGSGNSNVAGYKKFESNTFVRINDEKNDIHDLRYLVKLEEIDGNNLELMPKSHIEKHFSTSTLRVKNAEFFSYSLSDNFNRISETNQQRKPEFFGSVTNQIGAKIKADNILIQIMIKEEKFGIKMRSDYEYPIIIHFTNNDESEDKTTSIDTKTYYQLYKTKENSERFELKEVDGPISNGKFCHPIGG